MSRASRKKLFIYLTLAVNAFYTIGCTNQQIGVMPGTNVTTESSASSVGNGLNFKKVSNDRENLLGGFIARGLTPNNASGSAPTAVPSASAISAPMPMATAAYSDSYSSGSPGFAYPSSTPGYYPQPYPMPSYAPYVPSYFGSTNSFEEYVMVDFSEAKKAGSTGSYLSILKNTVNPVIALLSSDARLISTYGNTDSKGNTVPNTNPSINPSAYPGYPVPYATSTAGPVTNYNGYNPYQWQFTYTSSSKKEIYSILVSGDETLIIKQKWALKDLAPQNIKIDSTEAIELVRKAVENTNDNVITVPTAYNYNGDTMSYLTEIPKDAKVSYSLEQDNSDLFWYVSFYYSNEQDPSYYYSSGSARVNVSTGEVKDLYRIGKYKQTPYQTYTPTPYISPSSTPYTQEPYVSPTPTPYFTTTPSASPQQ